MSIIVISCDEVEEKGRHYQMNPNSKTEIDIPTQAKSIKHGNNRIMVYSFNGQWKINYGDEGWGDDECTFEIFYTKSNNTYELKLEGFQPKNHSAYKDISKLMIDINNAVVDGHDYKYIRENIINLMD